MDRLQTELQRLYQPAGQDGGVRALVLELAPPAGWAEVARVWQGVQADLQLPAPAIAVTGRDGWQLWFSLLQPVAAAAGHAFLDALRRRYLDQVVPQALRLSPPAVPGVVPPAAVGPERWSAFVAPDLAPLFEQEPWLDHPPGAEAQGELLGRLASIPAEAFARVVAAAAAAPAAAAQGTGSEALDPRGFLLAVMRDPTVEMQLRIEAAKALLGG